jgi:cupin 2 domain-containing protein
VKSGNLFIGATPPAEGEFFETLLNHSNLVIERIISSATITPTEYVQTQDEWVLLVAGAAVLEVAGVRQELKEGDYLFLPAGVPHTVLSTSEGALWLALHLHESC